jgi:hypothetical protein
MAEGAGFEPARRLHAYTLSKRAPSATRPPLRCSHATPTLWKGAEGGHYSDLIGAGKTCEALFAWFFDYIAWLGKGPPYG